MPSCVGRCASPAGCRRCHHGSKARPPPPGGRGRACWGYPWRSWSRYEAGAPTSLEHKWLQHGYRAMIKGGPITVRFTLRKRAGGAEDRRSIIQLSRLLASFHNPSGVCPFGYSCSCTSSASQMKTPPRLPPSSANWPAPSFCSPQPDGNLILFLVSSHLTSSFKVGI